MSDIESGGILKSKGAYKKFEEMFDGMLDDKNMTPDNIVDQVLNITRKLMTAGASDAEEGNGLIKRMKADGEMYHYYKFYNYYYTGYHAFLGEKRPKAKAKAKVKAKKPSLPRTSSSVNDDEKHDVSTPKAKAGKSQPSAKMVAEKAKKGLEFNSKTGRWIKKCTGSKPYRSKTTGRCVAKKQ